ncbi:MAG: EamA family transporter [Bacteroidota bacterium]
MRDLRGYAMILGAALFWGASATAAKALLNRNLDTVLIVQTRVSFTFLLLLVFYLLFRRDLLRVRVRDLWQFALLGVIGIAGSNFTYYFTIRESTVATGILIQYTAPLAVMAYGASSSEETLTPLKLVAGAASLAGCFLAVGGYDPGVLRLTPPALLTGAASVLCFAFLSVFARRPLARYSVWTVMFYALGSASLFWLAVHPPWGAGAPLPDGETWAELAALAVVSILIPHSLYFAGLRRVPPSRAVITGTFEPVVAILTAALFLGELLEPLQIAGAGIVLGAIGLLQVRQDPPVKE